MPLLHIYYFPHPTFCSNISHCVYSYVLHRGSKEEHILASKPVVNSKSEWNQVLETLGLWCVFNQQTKVLEHIK